MTNKRNSTCFRRMETGLLDPYIIEETINYWMSSWIKTDQEFPGVDTFILCGVQYAVHVLYAEYTRNRII